MGIFDEADLQKAYAWSQGKDDKTLTIASISFQICSKLKAWTKTAPPPGFNISPSEDPYNTSGLTHEAVEDEDISLLGEASLAFDPEEDDISLLENETSLIGNDVYPPKYVSH